LGAKAGLSVGFLITVVTLRVSAAVQPE